MLSSEAAAYLAGVEPTDGAQASAPTNLHVISGTVSEGSENGKVRVAVDGLVFSQDDDQYVYMDSLGGLEEGDTATILLSGESGRAMTPLAIGSVGSVDRIIVRITEIESDYVKATLLEADVAELGFVHATEGVIDNAKIDHADVNELDTNYAHISNGVIDNATIDEADVNNLTANYAHLTNGVIDNATISHASVDELETRYAQIDGANINSLTNQNAWIDKLMVQTGLIAHEGTVYTLDAIQVNAASITAGTIDVDRLIVTTNGEKYLVNLDVAGNPTYVKLDGGVIEDYTITADKIVAGAVTAEKITTENIVGSGGWINLRNGTFSYVNAETGEGIVWDGRHLYISGDVTIGDEIITKISDSISDIVYDIEMEEFYDSSLGIGYILTAHVYKATVDITHTIDPDLFVWYIHGESGSAYTLFDRGISTIAYANAAGYRATIVGGVDEVLQGYNLADSSNLNVIDSDGNRIEIYTVWSF